MSNPFDFSWVHKTIEAIKDFGWQVSLPVSAAIYLIFFPGKSPFSPASSEGPFLLLQFLMVALFFLGVVSVAAQLVELLRERAASKARQEEARLSDLTHTVLMLERAVERESFDHVAKHKDQSSNAKLTASLFSFYSRLRDCRIPTPDIAVHSGEFQISSNLEFLRIMAPLISSGQLDVARAEASRVNCATLPRKALQFFFRFK